MAAGGAPSSPEPSMYRHRPASERTQDISHLLTSIFKSMYTADVIGMDTGTNLIKSRGGDNIYHEKFVEELQKIHTEYNHRLTEADMIEKHIIQARARATAEEERALNMLKADAGEDFHNTGLPPAGPAVTVERSTPPKPAARPWGSRRHRRVQEDLMREHISILRDMQQMLAQKVRDDAQWRVQMWNELLQQGRNMCETIRELLTHLEIAPARAPVSIPASAPVPVPAPPPMPDSTSPPTPAPPCTYSPILPGPPHLQGRRGPRT